MSRSAVQAITGEKETGLRPSGESVTPGGRDWPRISLGFALPSSRRLQDVLGTSSAYSFTPLVHAARSPRSVTHPSRQEATELGVSAAGRAVDGLPTTALQYPHPLLPDHPACFSLLFASVSCVPQWHWRRGYPQPPGGRRRRPIFAALRTQKPRRSLAAQPEGRSDFRSLRPVG